MTISSSLAIVFPGQGSQSVGMLDAWSDNAVVKQTLAEASDALGEDVGALIANGPAEALSLTTNTLAAWADQHLFSVAVALAFSPAGFKAFRQRVSEKFVEDFVNDRAKMRQGGSGLSMDANTALQLLPIYLQQTEQQLKHAGPYICGKHISIADFSIYHCLWFINNNAGVRG